MNLTELIQAESLNHKLYKEAVARNDQSAIGLWALVKTQLTDEYKHIIDNQKSERSSVDSINAMLNEVE